jgi:hypothetical protein
MLCVFPCSAFTAYYATVVNYDRKFFVGFAPGRNVLNCLFYSYKKSLHPNEKLWQNL